MQWGLNICYNEISYSSPMEAEVTHRQLMKCLQLYKREIQKQKSRLLILGLECGQYLSFLITMT